MLDIFNSHTNIGHHHTAPRASVYVQLLYWKPKLVGYTQVGRAHAATRYRSEYRAQSTGPSPYFLTNDSSSAAPAACPDKSVHRPGNFRARVNRYQVSQLVLNRLPLSDRLSRTVRLHAACSRRPAQGKDILCGGREPLQVRWRTEASTALSSNIAGKIGTGVRTDRKVCVCGPRAGRCRSRLPLEAVVRGGSSFPRCGSSVVPGRTIVDRSRGARAFDKSSSLIHDLRDGSIGEPLPNMNEVRASRWRCTSYAVDRCLGGLPNISFHASDRHARSFWERLTGASHLCEMV